MRSHFTLIFFAALLWSESYEKKCAQSEGKKITKCDFKLAVVGPEQINISWNAKALRKRGIRSIRFSAKTINPPMSKMFSELTKVNAGFTKIIKLNPFTEYTLSVKKGGLSKTVKVGTFKTWPSVPNVRVFYGKALSSTIIGLKWEEPNPPNGILKPYEVECINPNGDKYRSGNVLSNTSTSAIITNLKPHNTYKCMLIASTIPHKLQNPEDCVIVKDISIHTFKVVDMFLHYLNIDPRAPRNVRLSARGSHTAYLSWNHASFDNKVVEAYAIEWKINNEKKDLVFLFQRNSLLFTGLLAGQSISATIHPIPIWQFYSELNYSGPSSKTVEIIMPTGL